MATSGQLTEKINSSPNPVEAELAIWGKCRYLVAQHVASNDFTGTIPGYFKGRVVVPGPNANKKLSEVLTITDLSIVKSRYAIRFVDNNTTDNADDQVKRSLFTVMSKAEADSYERDLRKFYAERKPEGVSSSSTE